MAETCRAAAACGTVRNKACGETGAALLLGRIALLPLRFSGRPPRAALLDEAQDAGPVEQPVTSGQPYPLQPPLIKQKPGVLPAAPQHRCGLRPRHELADVGDRK